MLNFILKKAVPIPDITKYERYLFIAPHPDDAEVAAAPTIKRLTEAGKTVAIVIATDGRMGETADGLSGEALARVRREEATASAKYLGAKELVFLPFADAGDYTPRQLAAEIAKETVKFKPDIIFAPDPDVASETHADHLKTGTAAKYAMNMSPYPAIMKELGVGESFTPKALAFYFTDRPNSYVAAEKYYGCRETALGFHRSQFNTQTVQPILTYYKLKSTFYGLRRLKGKSDGFRVLAAIHTHCFPEASLWR